MIQDEKELLLQKFAEVNRRLIQANEQLERANRKLKEYEEKAARAEKASEMKTLFLANMSHEIRTPLNAIEGFSRIMAETDSPEERQGFMEIIESNNTRLLSLINEILDLSRVESGEITLKNTPTDLATLMSSIRQLFRFRCPDTVSLSIAKPAEVVVMNTDENRLTQVLSNLISNALKHTPRGTISYGFELCDDNHAIEFFVSDTGSGIAPEFIGRIFDAYASRDADQQQGFGLGLALCKIIVEKMGGTIAVRSTLGEGSTFTFRIPFHGTVGGMATSSRTPTNYGGYTLRVTSKPGSEEQKTILVAEDEESNYQLVSVILQKRYRLLRAHNGIEAVTINEDEHPDLVLMDIRMPDMNGLDATRIIKEVTPATPVIAVSAFAFEENKREARAAGCDDFMAKPVKVEDLVALIKKYLK